jgi:hypothetical protein
MKRSLILAVAAVLLMGAKPVWAGPASATIALTESEPVSGDVTYAVTETNMANPYEGWVRQLCYLGTDLVDVQYQGVVWTSVTQGPGHHSQGSGLAGPFQTSGIHEGSGGVNTPWSSDRCEAYVWDYPDFLDPISTVLSFSVA